MSCPLGALWAVGDGLARMGRVCVHGGAGLGGVGACPSSPSIKPGYSHLRRLKKIKHLSAHDGWPRGVPGSAWLPRGHERRENWHVAVPDSSLPPSTYVSLCKLLTVPHTEGEAGSPFGRVLGDLRMGG